MKQIDLFESDTHAFVIKIWLEENSGRDAKRFWRGYITHIPSGEKRYIQSPYEILLIISLYVEKIGIKLPLKWRIIRMMRKDRYRRLREQDR